jgi:hypothetical protein
VTLVPPVQMYPMGHTAACPLMTACLIKGELRLVWKTTQTENRKIVTNNYHSHATHPAGTLLHGAAGVAVNVVSNGSQ